MRFLARAIFARHKSKVARYLANIVKSLWVIDSNNECERCERPDADDLIQAVGDRGGAPSSPNRSVSAVTPPRRRAHERIRLDADIAFLICNLKF